MKNKKVYTVSELSKEQHIYDAVTMAHMYTKELPQKEYVDIDEVMLSSQLCIADYTRKFLNAWIAYKHEQPIGIAIGARAKNWHNKESVAELRVWYVIPSERGSRAALYLLKAFEHWAIIQGSHIIYTGVSSNLSKELTEKTSNLLVKFGYPVIGVQHSKELGT